MSNFCSNCGSQIEDDVNFCSKCGKNLVNTAMQNANALEIPSSEHINAFSKWFKLTCTAFAVGIVSVFIGLGTAFVCAADAGGRVETTITVFIAGSVVALIASVILLCMTVNVRMKTQHTRTNLRFGTRFAELSLSCMNIALAFAFATCRVFNDHFGFDTMFAVYITAIAALFVIIIECGVEHVKSKYKSDKKYGDKASQNKPVLPKVAEQPKKSVPAPEAAPKKTWKCRACGFNNHEHSDYCRSCGKYK